MEFLNPEQVLNELELSDSMIAADFGSGSGGWTIPLAKKLKTGKVYAIDIQDSALAGLKMKAEMAKLNNIKPIQADLEVGAGSSVQTGLLDLVLVTNLLFQAKNKDQIFKEAARVLKTRGKLLVVDWKIEAKIGPETGRLTEQEVEDLAKNAGFSLDKKIKAGQYHYGLLFQEK